MSEKNCVANAILKNPLMVLFLGACPAMAATATLWGGFGMGLAVLAVMLLSNLVIALLKKVMPQQALIPVCVVVSAGFVSAVQMLMNAFLPEIYQMLGIYVAVAAVDLLIFGSADEASVAGAVKNGLRLLVVLVIMGVIREVFGQASFAGMDIPFLADYTIPVLTKAPGGFIVYSIVAAVISKLHKNPAVEGQGAACAAAGIACCCCDNEEV
jgi:electron transport complex protein RnfE